MRSRRRTTDSRLKPGFCFGNWVSRDSTENPVFQSRNRVFKLHAPLFGRAAAVVRERGDVFDRLDVEPRGLKGRDGRLAAGARALHPHSISFTPNFLRLCRRHSSAARCAANGVLLRLPLNPTAPPDE